MTLQAAPPRFEDHNDTPDTIIDYEPSEFLFGADACLAGETLWFDIDVDDL